MKCVLLKTGTELKRRTTIFCFFIAVSVIHIFGFVIDNEIIRISSKPFIIPLLIVYYLNSVQLINRLFIVALVFSFLGDVLLISDAALNFMFGLGSFLTAHILYIVIVVKQLQKSSIQNKIIAAMPFVLVFYGLISLLINHLGEMLLPVVVYGVVISVFGMVALLNFLVKKSRSSLVLFFGTLFFILSDSILAINKFYDSQEFYPMLIMITYITAQYLICRYMITKNK